MARYSSTRINSRTVRFYDRAATRIISEQAAMSPEEKRYTALNNAFTSNSKTVGVTPPTASSAISASIRFESTSFPAVPPGFDPISKKDFTVFVNGIAVEADAIDSIQESGSNVVVTFNQTLNYDIDSNDEFMITGKIE